MRSLPSLITATFTGPRRKTCKQKKPRGPRLRVQRIVIRAFAVDFHPLILHADRQVSENDIFSVGNIQIARHKSPNTRSIKYSIAKMNGDQKMEVNNISMK
jgi:hypothetical protein